MDASSSTHRSRGAERRGADLWGNGVLPVLLAGTLSGLLGIYWDIAWHIELGRDSFFSPPHNFIYGALAITLLVGAWGLWRDRRASPLHLPVGRARLHPGLLIATVAALLELFFAPADELWHRLFGADVTLWAPMHLVGVLGMTMLAFGGLVTAWVERRLALDPRRRRLFGRLALVFGAVLLGWLMLALAEFEFNVPAFPMLWHPLLLIGLPGFALALLARLRPVPWAATWGALLFTGLRLALAVLLLGTAEAGLAGSTRPMIPLLLGGAVVADLLLGRRHRGAPAGVLAGAGSGVAIGAALLASNWPLVLLGAPDWHAAALLWGVPLGLLLAAFSSRLGLAVAAALEPVASQPGATTPGDAAS